MFEKEIKQRNKHLVDFVKKMHDEKSIEPDTYVIDLDSVSSNAKKLFEKANKLGITLFQMTKQFGRNPVVAKEIYSQGITDTVAVDWKEAEMLFKNGIKIGNIGHVVQVPKTKIELILNMSPKVWTIFSMDNLIDINKVAENKKVVQDVIIRVYSDQKYLYPSQKGGVHIDNLNAFIKATKKLKNIKIVGLTSFPTMLFNEKTRKIEKTKNADTVIEAINILKENGIEPEHINLPSANNYKSLDLIKELGGNYGEPGHALTGTTPITENSKNIEIPAMLYYSQVSHIFENKVIAFAGGHYRRSKIKGAFIGDDLKFHKNIPLDSEAIDYYFELEKNDHKVKPGDIAIFAFRFQLFVCRSKLLVVKGLSKNNPEIIGLYDSQGKIINE